MNRPLKFRVWAKSGKFWFKPDMFAISKDSIYPFGVSPETVVVQQFTGLEDKYHHEIYEGDILRWTHPMDDIGEVKYIVSEHLDAPYPNQCYYAFVNKKRGICHFQEDDEYEIIGNIFENKELLENE